MVIDAAGNEIHSNYNAHPGEMLTDEIEALGIVPRELAERMGRPLDEVCEILACKRDVDYGISIDLERALGIPAYLWNRLQHNYERNRV